MFRKIILVVFFLFIGSFSHPAFVLAQQVSTDCPNRFLTIINPVRSRQLWINKTIQPLKDQYNLIASNDFPATWLIQDDVLSDQDLIYILKNFNKTQEFGLLLEVSDQLANNSRVVYPSFVPWYNPKAVFLSGYTQSERRLLIDQMFKNFFHTFGYYPKSVGAWWIDSYSLQYMKDKYQIKSAMIVADQKTTDSYGVWGQWWGVPYYPGRANILTPASATDNKLDVVILQWAQRDLLLAHNEGPKSSNFSLQANDYISLGKNTDYFKSLVSTYLNCINPLGQVTVGLETGIESVGYLSEYKNQLFALKNIKGLQTTTMEYFSTQFAKVYPSFPQQATLGDASVIWQLNTKNRINNNLNDFINYNQNQSFADYFVADRSSFLDRNLTLLGVNQQNANSSPLYLFVFLGFGIAAYFLKKVKLWIVTILFIIGAYGLILRSFIQYGWIIYYSVVYKNIESIQIGLVVFSFILMWLIDKWTQRTLLKNSLFLYLIPLIFGLDIILKSLRYTSISGRQYFGIMVDTFRMIGVGFKPPFNLTFINQDFPSIQVAALLKLDFEKIWNNFWLTIIVFPLAHVLFAVIIAVLLLTLPKYIRKIIFLILILLFILQIINIFQTDPRTVIFATI